MLTLRYPYVDYDPDENPAAEEIDSPVEHLVMRRCDETDTRLSLAEMARHMPDLKDDPRPLVTY